MDKKRHKVSKEIRKGEKIIEKSAKNCVIRGKYVINTDTDDELLLDINREIFQNDLIKMFGKKKNIKK